MDKLCDKGLIIRLPCPDDRRVVHIQITDSGLLLLKDIDQNFKEDLLENLTEHEASLLSDLLDKIR
jgi:DNA-binding MarR family transcriptional regulator